MKQIILHLMLFFCLISYGQIQTDSTATNKRNYYNNQNNPFDKIVFKVGVGIFIPQGRLISYFGTSPLLNSA